MNVPDKRQAQDRERADGERREEMILIEQSLRGQTSAFADLVTRHHREVFAVALAMMSDYDEAEDIAQDAFVRAFRSLSTFRGESKFSTWLIGITINLCREKRRWWLIRRKYIATSLDDPVETGEGAMPSQVEDPSDTADVIAMKAEDRSALMEALDRLDPASRSILVLREIQGMSYIEIAQMLGCRMGTVKSRINRARLLLRERLKGKL